MADLNQSMKSSYNMSNVSPERSLNRKQLLMANNPGYKGAASLSPRVAS
jgi:hypothetical protein